MRRCPWYVRVAMVCTRSFRVRSVAVRLWCYFGCMNPISSALYRMKHPFLMAEVDRRVRLSQQGVEVLDA